MKNKICCFAGHRDMYDTDKVFSALENKIEHLILNENVNEFWVGNYGSFDAIAAKCVRTLKNRYKDIRLTLVIPYLTKTINDYKKQYYEDYDDILIADIPMSTPAQYKILKCNEYMVKESDYIICYIKHSWGGAAKTLEYAQKHNIKIININDYLKKK